MIKVTLPYPYSSPVTTSDYLNVRDWAKLQSGIRQVTFDGPSLTIEAYSRVKAHGTSDDTRDIALFKGYRTSVDGRPTTTGYEYRSPEGRTSLWREHFKTLWNLPAMPDGRADVCTADHTWTMTWSNGAALRGTYVELEDLVDQIRKGASLRTVPIYVDGTLRHDETSDELPGFAILKRARTHVYARHEATGRSYQIPLAAMRVVSDLARIIIARVP